MTVNIKRIAITAIVVLIALGVERFTANQSTGNSQIPNASSSQSLEKNNQGAINQKAPQVDSKAKVLRDIKQAADSQRSGWWLTTKGKVIKLLKDDNKGSRHQKFILEIERGTTLLVAHNIDLAPRVPIQNGDVVSIRARYEWNHRGGVLHWTHHDPKGRQKGGWIYLNGKYFK